jgi:hypothetical protein
MIMYSLKESNSHSNYLLVLRQMDGINFFKYQFSNEAFKELKRFPGYKCEDNASFYYELTAELTINIVTIFSKAQKVANTDNIMENKSFAQELQDYISKHITEFKGVFICPSCGFDEYSFQHLYYDNTGAVMCDKCGSILKYDYQSLNKQSNIYKESMD